MNYIVYDKSTGEIIQQIDTPTLESAEEGLDLNAVGLIENEQIDDSLYYVDINTLDVILRTNIPYVINGTNIENIPIGTRLFMIINNGENIFNIDDGIAELIFDEPGTYDFTLRHPTYLDTEGQIVAN